MERYHIFKLGLAITFYAIYCIRPMMVIGQETDDVNGNSKNKYGLSDEDYYVYYQGVEGTPGIDFPILSHIPRTSFGCEEMESGYYADLETDCQVFHICEEGRKISFLCPNGTVFSQGDLICEWWFKVNCTEAPNLYFESSEHLRGDQARSKANRRVITDYGSENTHGAVMRLEEHASVSATQNGRKFNLINDNVDGIKKNPRPQKSVSSSLGNHEFSQQNVRENINHKKRVQSRNKNEGNLNDFNIQTSERSEVNTDRSNRRFGKHKQNLIDRSYEAERDSTVHNIDIQKPNSNFVESNKVTRRQRTSTTQSFRDEIITTTVRTNIYSGNKKANKINKDVRNNHEIYQQYEESENQDQTTLKNDIISNTYRDSNTGSRRQNNNIVLNLQTNRKVEESIHQAETRNKHKQSDNIRLNLQTNQQQYKIENHENKQSFRNGAAVSITDANINTDQISYTGEEIKNIKTNHHTNPQFRENINADKEKQNNNMQLHLQTNPQAHEKIGNNNISQGRESFRGVSASTRLPSLVDEGDNTNIAKQNEDIKLHIQTSDQYKESIASYNRERTTLFRDETTTPSNIYQDKNPNNRQQSNNIKLHLQTKQQHGENENSGGTKSFRGNFVSSTISPQVFTGKNNKNDEFVRIHVQANQHYNTNNKNSNVVEKSISTKAVFSNSEDSQKSHHIVTTEPYVNKGNQLSGKSDKHNESPANTIALNKKDVVERKLEPSDSDESQITQETASFYKNSANRIRNDYKTTTNPYPNHRTTYSDLRDPKQYQDKYSSSISSVTPQYITTQSINNGKPFLGSTVGLPLKPRPFAVSSSIGTPSPVSPSILASSIERSVPSVSLSSEGTIGTSIFPYNLGKNGPFTQDTYDDYSTRSPHYDTGVNAGVTSQNDQRTDSYKNADHAYITSTTPLQFAQKNTTSHIVEKFSIGYSSTPSSFFDSVSTSPVVNAGYSSYIIDNSIQSSPSTPTLYFSTTAATNNQGGISSKNGVTPFESYSSPTPHAIDTRNNAATVGYIQSNAVSRDYPGHTHGPNCGGSLASTHTSNVNTVTNFNTGSAQSTLLPVTQPTPVTVPLPVTERFNTGQSSKPLLVSIPTGLPLLRRGSALVSQPGSHNTGKGKIVTQSTIKLPVTKNIFTSNPVTQNQLRTETTTLGSTSGNTYLPRASSNNFGARFNEVTPTLETPKEIYSTVHNNAGLNQRLESTVGTIIPKQELFNDGKSTIKVSGKYLQSTTPSSLFASSVGFGVSNQASGKGFSTLGAFTSPPVSVTPSRITNSDDSQNSTVSPENSTGNTYSVSYIDHRIVADIPRSSPVNHISSSSTPPTAVGSTHIASRTVDVIPTIGSLNAGNSTVKVRTTTPPSHEFSTVKTVDHATVWGTFRKTQTTPAPSTYSYKGGSYSSTPNSLGGNEKTVVNKFNSAGTTYSPSSTPRVFVNEALDTTASSRPYSPGGFFVTKDSTLKETTKAPYNNLFVHSTNTPTSLDAVRPRPFQKLTAIPRNPELYTSTRSSTSPPTKPTYIISSAAPFTKATTPSSTASSFEISNSVYENVDNMINALMKASKEAERDYSSETPRPGLVIPPSAGPQTLHSLAAYFANALDEAGVQKDEDGHIKMDKQEKERLTALLTKMTMDRYNELFGDRELDESDEDTATNNKSNEQSDLEGQHSKNPVQTPQVRQLAKMFTQALSAYLDDPDTFKKSLEDVRPTEPPPLQEDTTSPDDELLNFSDADAKSSYPPIFPTVPSISPTWGYIIALNRSKNVDSEIATGNSLNTDENLRGADSHSFVSQFNNLKSEDKQIIKSDTSSSLPPNHWTTSPDATKLWRSTLSVNPIDINYSFKTTEPTVTPIEEITEEILPDESLGTLELPHSEVNYEVRTLPKLSLNSTQVRGLLIDFMNNTKTEEDNKLIRILKRLNTTEDEFLEKMKEIESNPLTKRLILLLISECGENATRGIDTRSIPNRASGNDANINEDKQETLNFASSNHGAHHTQNSNDFKIIVDPSLDDGEEDTRALQLLNSLYSIASKFGK